MASEDSSQNQKSSDNTASYNAGLKYAYKLIELEDLISFCLLHEQFHSASEYLDVLWMELVEWMDENEYEEHLKLRQEQLEAAKRINIYLSKKMTRIPTVDIESFKFRFVKLKMIINKKGLRMPKDTDQSDVPALIRRAQMSYGSKRY